MSDLIEWLKASIKQASRRVGFEISRFDPAHSEPARIAAVLEYCGIELLFDVGANTGQFGHMVRRAGYRRRIVSFEPLSSAHAQLVRSARNDKLWSVHPRSALGSKKGKVEINIAGNSLSSSILPMLPSHSEAAPESRFVSTEITDVTTLDSVFQHYRTDAEPVYLKIDTQGFEKEVLEGARESLASIRAIQLELSLVELYQNQPLWDYFLPLLKERGFSVWALMPVFSDPRTGRCLQLDVVFCRT